MMYTQAHILSQIKRNTRLVRS